MISETGMQEFIERVASHVAGSYPPYVETDDMASTLWVWYLENRATVDGLIRDDESWESKLYSTMRKVASTFAAKTEAEYHGYSLEDVYHYTTPVVRELLKDALDYENWQSFSSFGDGQPKAKRQSATSDRMEMLIDVKSAVGGLNEDQQEIIEWHFKYGMDYAMIGEALEISEEAARIRLDRAVKAVQRGLGKKSFADMRNAWDAKEKIYATSGERSRISNAQAIAMQENMYEG